MSSHYYYRPSGKVPASAPAYIVWYVFATLPVAWAYAWSIVNAPALLEPFFTLCFSLWLGFMVQRAGKRAKVRNANWLTCGGIAIILAGWYFQWAAWIAQLAHITERRPGDHPLIGTFIGLVLHPGTLLGAAMDVARIGTWGLGEWRVTGGMLALFWVAELGLLLAFVRIFADMQVQLPFCETSNTWAEDIEVARKFAFIDEPHRVPSFLQQNPRDLLSVLDPWYESASLSYAKVTLHRCRGADSYLSIHNVAAAIEKGKIKESSEPVLVHLRMPGIDPDELMQELLDAVPAVDAGECMTQAGASDLKELEPALEHFNAGRFEAALDGAEPYLKVEQPGLRADANRLCGLANARLEHWTVAAACWHALFDDEPTAHNGLQVATSLVMCRELESGILWAERARRLNAASGDVPGVTLETSFLTALTQAGYMEAAMPYLDAIKKYYLAVGITDPTVLFAKRLHRFDVFLDKSATVVRANLDTQQEQVWYASMLPHLDNRGQTELSAWMDARLRPRERA